MTKQECLWKEYIQERENTAGLVLADYLEENDIDLPLAKGLRFCIKHNKFPRQLRNEYYNYAFYNDPKFYYYWDLSSSNVCKNKTTNSILPRIFSNNSIEYARYKSIKNAMRAVGNVIITFKKLTQDII